MSYDRRSAITNKDLAVMIKTRNPAFPNFQ